MFLTIFFVFFILLTFWVACWINYILTPFTPWILYLDISNFLLKLLFSFKFWLSYFSVLFCCLLTFQIYFLYIFKYNFSSIRVISILWTVSLNEDIWSVCKFISVFFFPSCWLSLIVSCFFVYAVIFVLKLTKIIYIIVLGLEWINLHRRSAFGSIRICHLKSKFKFKADIPHEGSPTYWLRCGS